MGSEWTKEERVLCALSREEADRVPLYDLVSSVEFIEHFAGKGLTLENAHEVVPLAMSRSLDTTRIFLPEALGVRKDSRGFTYERRDWFNEWMVKAPFNDLESLAGYVGREIERLRAWQPEDPETAREELLTWKERYAGAVIPASWAGEAMQDNYIEVGLDWFTWLDAERPELVQEWIAARHGQLMRRLQSEAGCREISPLAWIFGDVAYKERLIFSPKFLQRHGFFRNIAEICDLYHSCQLKVIFHSDGYITPIVPDLIEAGVDAIAPVDTLAGMDLKGLKEAYGDRLAFVGGIDVENVLRMGSVQDVRRCVLGSLMAAGKGGGLILGTSSEEIFETLPLENVLAMLETTWECGRYPIGHYFPKSYF
jgi:uroporphyrinogen decarboxylase